jgi:hypothetical protein
MAGGLISNFFVGRAMAKRGDTPVAAKKAVDYTRGQQLFGFDHDSSARVSNYHKDTGKYTQVSGSIFDKKDSDFRPSWT